MSIDVYTEPDITRDEAKILYAAEQELYSMGNTNIVCPRCGKRIIKDSMPFPVRCENKNCLKLGSRGI